MDNIKRDAILVIDDDPVNRQLVRAQLEVSGHQVLEATGGTEGAALIEQLGNSLGAVILDLHMPHMSGFDVLERARSQVLHGHLPIIVVTAAGDRDSRRRAAALGADEFLTKPVDQIELVAKIRNAIRLRRLFRRMISIQGVLDGLAVTIEERDHYTEDHTLRVAVYATWISDALGVPLDTQLQLMEGALLHDVGKVGVADSVLLKEGRLTPEEYGLMQRHVEIGAKICASIGVDEVVIQVVRHHHERFDGGGYPDHLSGEGIPLVGRIAAVADAFDAMTSNRPYRKAKTWDEAIAELEDGKGTQWDPRIVDSFIRLLFSDLHLKDAVRIGGSRLKEMLAVKRQQAISRLDIDIF